MSAQLRRRDAVIVASPPFQGNCLPGKSTAEHLATAALGRWSRETRCSLSLGRMQLRAASLLPSTRRKRARHGPFKGALERKRGFEPPTLSLARRCSTTEPLPHASGRIPQHLRSYRERRGPVKRKREARYCLRCPGAAPTGSDHRRSGERATMSCISVSTPSELRRNRCRIEA